MDAGDRGQLIVRTSTPWWLTLSQAHAWPSSILVDELDARAFECSPNNFERGAARLTSPSFQLMDGDDSDAGLVRKILLIPSKQSACRPGLFRRNHASENEG